MDLHATTVHKEHVSVIEKARRIGYGGLYQINQNITTAERFFYLSTAITTLQMLYFAVAIQTASSTHHILVDVIEPALRVVSFGFMPLSSDFAMLSLMVTAGVSVMVMIVGVCLMGLDDMNNTSRYSFVAPLVDFLFKLNQTVLQIPILVVLLRVLRCDMTYSSNILTCEGSGYVVEQSIACLVLAFHVIATSIYALVVFNQSPYTIKGRNNKLFAMPHGRVECLVTLMRALCTILYMLMLPKQTQVQSTVTRAASNALAAIIFICGLIIMGGYWYFLPFYNIKWNVFAAASGALVAWGGICAFVANSVNDATDNSSFLLLAVPTTFVITSVIALVYHRIEKLKASSENIFAQSPYLLETRLRLLHQNAHASEEFAFSGEAEKAYRHALEMLPDNPYISLYVSLLASSAGNRIIFALNLLTRVRQSQLPFDLDFTLFCHNKRNAESQTFSSGSVSFVQLDQHLAEARKSLISTLRYTTSFWKKITHGNCTLSQILQQGAKVHEESSKCRYHLTRLRKLSRSNREGLRLYALYYYYVMNDRESAIALERELSSANNFDEGHGSAVATISGNSSTLGQVLEVSDAMCSLFGFSKNEIIGRNVSILCPSPFAEMHDMFLKQFITTDSEFATQTRRIFGMHGKGYIMATDFEVTPSTNTNSELILIGRFKRVPQPAGQHLLMVDAKTGFVTSFTQNACEALGFDESDVFAMNLHISDILIDFFDDEDNSVQYRKEREATLNAQAFKVSARLIEYKNKVDSTVNFHVSIYMVAFHAITDQNLFGHASVTGRSRALQSPSVANSSTRAKEETKMSTLVSDEEDNSDFDGSESEVGEEDDGQSNVSEEMASPRISKGSYQDAEANERVNPLGSGKFSAISAGSRGRKKQQKKDASGISGNESVGSYNSSRRGGGNRRRSRGAGESIGESSAGALDSRGLEISQVHRRVMRKLQRKDPNLQRFGRFARRFVVFFTIFTIAEAVFKTQILAQYLDLSSMVKHAHFAQHLVVASSLTVLMKIFPSVEVSGAVYDRTPVDDSALLLDFAEELKLDHQELVAAVEKSSSSTLDGLMNDPLVYSTIDADYYRNLSFHVAMLEYISHVNNHVEEDQLECEESCQFIINNSPFEVSDTLENLARQFRDEAYATLDFFHLAETVILATVGCLLLAYFFKGYLPMFLSNDRRKKHVGKAFLAIPEDICKKLLNRTERRLQQLQTQQETDVTNEDENDLDDEGVEGHEGMGEDDGSNGSLERKLSSDGRAENKDSHEQSDALERTDSQAKYSSQRRSPASVAPLRLPDMAVKKKPQGFASVKVAPARSGGKGNAVGTEKRLIKNESLTVRILRTVFLNFHIGISFWTVMAYYGTDYFLQMNAESTMRIRAAVVYAAGLQAATASLLHLWAVHPSEVLAWERVASGESRLARMKALYAELLDVDYALRYGDEASYLPPFTYTDGPQFQLYFENACGVPCEGFLANFSAADETFSGLEHLRHGLALAFDHWLLDMKSIIEAEEIYLASGSSEDLNSLNEKKLAVLNLEPHLIISGKQFDAMQNYYAEEVEAVAQEKQVKIVGTVILIAALLMSHLLSLSAFTRLDQDLKKAQAALLLLPLETFTKVPALIRLLNEN
ncbi:Hypothetical Protein FCC1311_005032 [Hondaea fermentalgiana]|uniref:PAS domain-containing protein n=1 Tax=Hondaea fermentalgiana TaxID=2315210 RepID=A0A2R5G180_9STRA|nr:Hypothetical Protein FCC1311_005032 [Hondaea fermentalgiana]|eukprot:GBG24285.1 Hypothetical Protein FCC1311_005032 [Hondaea fermentalgiana]